MSQFQFTPTLVLKEIAGLLHSWSDRHNPESSILLRRSHRSSFLSFHLILPVHFLGNEPSGNEGSSCLFVADLQEMFTNEENHLPGRYHRESHQFIVPWRLPVRRSFLKNVLLVDESCEDHLLWVLFKLRVWWYRCGGNLHYNSLFSVSM